MTIARLSGELDHHSAATVREELDRCILTQQPKLMIIDFKDITFMDSSGIGLIMGRQKLVEGFGGKLEVHRPQPHIQRIMKLSGIERIVRIV